MRYFTIETGGAQRTAASVNDRDLFILPQFSDMNDLIMKGGISKIPEDAQAVGEDVKILSPVPRPKQDVICLGINYAVPIRSSSPRE